MKFGAECFATAERSSNCLELQEAAEQELRTAASDSMLNRSPSDQNLPVTEASPTSGSQHGSDTYSRLSLGKSVSYLSKLESLASSAVRSADKVGAKLIIVYTQTGDPIAHGHPSANALTPDTGSFCVAFLSLASCIALSASMFSRLFFLAASQSSTGVAC